MTVFTKLRSIFQLRQPFNSPPLLVALLLQALALGVVKLLQSNFAIKITLFEFSIWCGLLAALFTYIVNLARWWLVIQCLFVPALLLTLSLNIKPSVFLLAFILTALVFWNTVISQVPLYLSSQKVWQTLEGFLPESKPGNIFTFVDIGSGLGGVLTHLAKARPDGTYTGVESAPLPFLWSWLRIHLGRHKQCRVLWGDFWTIDLAKYDVVFAYLSPTPMERLWQKAKSEMKPGSVFISSTFSVPGQIPNQEITVDDLHHSSLQVWRM